MGLLVLKGIFPVVQSKQDSFVYLQRCLFVCVGVLRPSQQPGHVKPVS